MDWSPNPTREEFQRRLDASPAGSNLTLFPREFPGPVVVRRPLTLDGREAVVWAMRGPVVAVDSDGVVLRNLRIEVTGTTQEEGEEDEAAECALQVRNPGSVRLENVEVRGRVTGLAGEEGGWRYPLSLRLGQLSHGMEHRSILRLKVPVPSTLASRISGLRVAPRQLSPGLNEIELRIERMPQDTLIHGRLALETPRVRRSIMVAGQILPAENSSAGHPVTLDSLLWEPPPEAPPLEPPPDAAKILVRGQKLPVAQLTTADSVRVGLAASGGRHQVYDAFCFGVDEKGRLSDERYFVFYNQKASHDGTVSMGEKQGSDLETFHLNLSRLPPSIRKVIFAVGLDGSGSMARMSQGYLRLMDDTGEKARFPFSGSDFTMERAMIAGEIYRKGVWRLAAVGQGFREGIAVLLKHFGWEEG